MRTAYKGYLIKADLLGTTFYISKDGYHIGSAPSVEAAKQEIDKLA